MGGLIASLAAITGLEAVLRRFLTLAVLALIGALFLIGALVFGLIAAHGALSVELGSTVSALIIGGVLLAIAAILLLYAVVVANGQTARPVRSAASTVASNPLLTMLPIFGPVAGSVLKRSPALAAIAVVVAGFFIARNGPSREG